MEDKSIEEILEDIYEFEFKYKGESLESVRQMYYDENKIQIEECRKTLGHNSRLYYITLPSRKVFLKEILASPRSFSGAKISGSKTNNPFGKELFWLTLFGKFLGFVPKVIYSNKKTSRIYMEHFESGSLDDNIDNILEQRREIESYDCVKESPNSERKLRELDLDIFDYTGDKEIRFPDIQIIHDNIARTVLNSRKPLFDYKRFDNNLENLISTLEPREIRARIKGFFDTIIGKFFDKKQQYILKKEKLEEEKRNWEGEYKPELERLEGEIEYLHSRLENSDFEIKEVKLMGLITVYKNMDVQEISTELSQKLKERTQLQEGLSSRISKINNELDALTWLSANHDNIIELRQKLANAVIKSCKTKTIGYIYRDEKKKFTIGNKYLSLDNHPGNCLMQDNLEFKLKKEPLTFCFGLLRTSGSYSAQNMAGIAKILRRFKENKELNEKEKQFYKRLCKQYDGLGLTDFHRFGKATMPYSTAIFYSHPSTLEIPYERKLDYVHHIIAQELRTSLEDNVDLRRKEFYEIKKEWIDRFRTASVYILLKNITYLYNLVRKEKQKDYGENGTLIDEKKFNKDKPLLFRRYVNYLRDLTAEDENNDNLFGKVYRTFKNMPVLLPD